MARSPKALPARAGIEPQQGEVHDVPARALMKVLWAARLCRRDLLRAAQRLATCVATWTSENDLTIYRRLGYIASAKHIRMYCWVGDSFAQITHHLYAYSCSATQRSTSACHHVLRGPFTRFPIVGISKRQGCVSHSTPEADMVALRFSMRMVGLPYLTFLAYYHGT